MEQPLNHICKGYHYTTFEVYSQSVEVRVVRALDQLMKKKKYILSQHQNIRTHLLKNIILIIYYRFENLS